MKQKLFALAAPALVSMGCSLAEQPSTGSHRQELTTGVFADIRISSQTSTSYCANVVLSNQTAAPITDWSFGLDLNDATLGSGWNADYSPSGGTLLVTPLSWNATIQPGQDQWIGYCANITGPDWDPEIATSPVSSSPFEQWRGLAVIADFADRSLEDYSGPGVTSEAELQLLLDDMQSHWSFLSRGTETIEWDIIRITLPVDYSASAYPSWWTYRDAVVEEVKKQTLLSDYDADGDGNYDAIWAIGSSGADNANDYMIGGASLNSGGNIFVDQQASYSVEVAAIGNFNHELAHLRGLVDLYGEFNTLGTLSLMSYSWDDPPVDFSAYDRIGLDWVEPTLLDFTQTVTLASAHDELTAAKIPTADPNEYFLIEYRTTPTSGFGSRAPDVDALAIYHVLEGSNQWQDPPLVRLVPADGALDWNQTLGASDFFSPGHPNLSFPFSVSAYDGSPVFSIANLARVAGSMQFDLIIQQ